MDVAVNLAVAEGVDFADAVAKARESGLHVTQALDDLGVVSGQIDRGRLPQLARIPGVSVEEDREVRTATR